MRFLYVSDVAPLRSVLAYAGFALPHSVLPFGEGHLEVLVPPPHLRAIVIGQDKATFVFV